VTSPSTALLLFAHGSSVEPANEAVRHVARSMAQAGHYSVFASFLEGGKPDLLTSVRELVDRGVQRIIVIPYFLTMGLHLNRDLPELVRRALLEHPTIRIEVTPPLDGHPALVEILLDRAATALAQEL
jgi:sirohydrochlorin ferrochelatase